MKKHYQLVDGGIPISDAYATNNRAAREIFTAYYTNCETFAEWDASERAQAYGRRLAVRRARKSY